MEALKRPITIKHLLTHTSGLIYDFSGGKELATLYERANLWTGPGLNDSITDCCTMAGKLKPVPSMILLSLRRPCFLCAC